VKAVSLAHGKKWLAGVWFSGSAVIFFLILVQTTLGKYGDRAVDVWGWILPTIMPSLSLIIGALVIDAKAKSRSGANVDGFFYRLTLWLSAVYLASVLMTLLMQPFSTLSPFKLMAQSNFWLGPFQGLVAAALGVFFIKSQTDPSQ